MKPEPPVSTFGRYRLLRVLGSGAMGRVHLAEDPRIERLLALKTVRLEGQPAEIEDRRRRLLLEAKATGRLIHPHIVTLFDADEVNDTFYLAFEYVAGPDLAARLEAEPPLTLREVLTLVRQAAEGLDFAHRRGIVHRDIKPSNLLVDPHGNLKIADFGIAKMAGQTADLTRIGSIVGSPHYLSPEQIRDEELDGRTDVFSLGVVLYELLAPRRPFEGDELAGLIYQILHLEPPPLAPGNEALAPLTALVGRMLAKERNERFPSAAAVAEALEALEAQLPAALLERPARAPFASAPVGEPAARPPRRRLAGWAALAVAGLALVWVLRGGEESPPEPAPSVAPSSESSAATIELPAPASLEGAAREPRVVRVREGVSLSVEPAEARVSIDGQDRGAASELTGFGRGFVRLTPGRHHLRVEAPGYEAVELWIEVSAGATSRRERIEVRLPEGAS
jgi:hypothetical protein